MTLILSLSVLAFVSFAPHARLGEAPSWIGISAVGQHGTMVARPDRSGDWALVYQCHALPPIHDLRRYETRRSALQSSAEPGGQVPSARRALPDERAASMDHAGNARVWPGAESTSARRRARIAAWLPTLSITLSARARPQHDNRGYHIEAWEVWLHASWRGRNVREQRL